MRTLRFTDVLSLSFLIHCCMFPWHLHNAGFMLSYGALVGISATSDLAGRFLVRYLPVRASDSLAASLGAQTVTAPLSLSLFGSFAPIGIIASTVVSPLVTVFIYSGLSAIVLTLIFPVLQVPSGIFMNFLYTVIKGLVLFFSKAPRIVTAALGGNVLEVV